MSEEVDDDPWSYFELVCLKCGSSKYTSIEPKNDPYWNDGYVIVCSACDIEVG